MHDSVVGEDGAGARGSGAEAGAPLLSARGAAIFSKNPDKAWAERAFLWGSAAWIAAVAVVVVSGWLKTWGDVGYLTFCVAAMAPVTFVPLALRPKTTPLLQSYFFKINVFVAILVFFGTYVGTHYFFDLMGMRYAFPTAWTFDAALVGKSGMHVPIFMYPLTQAYFVTYFTVMVIADRALRARFRLGRVGGALVVLALAYTIAFAETFFMATDLMKDLFSYEKKGRMLAVGSIGYAIYFVVGLPLIRGLDEEEAKPWSVGRVVMVALAASMAIFFLLEAWAKLVGRL